MTAFAILFLVLLLIQDFLLTFLLHVNFKHYHAKLPENYPLVSILIPARNEAFHLPSCLLSLEQLSYPKEKLQFVFGDDQSSDETYYILKSWVENHPGAHLISVSPPSPTAKIINGKANALAQMSEVSKGAYLLFTDADCQVPKDWVQEMLAGCFENVGIVTGITTVSGSSLLYRMQAIDWWLTLGMVKVLDDLNISLTSMGNNMLITREAYKAVGGFAEVPFSLTEDFEIAKKIQKFGFKGVHQVSPENLIFTSGIKKYSKLLEQRKRWMAGAFCLPFYWKFLLAVQVIFFPSILYLIIQYPLYGIFTWIIKIIVQGLFISVFSSLSGKRMKYWELIAFEIYYLITSWSTIVYYFWPSKTNWKGRNYS